ncbi:MAG: HupE/UreJ family protein [Roseovarius sp.]|jgi:urease accessory protein|uniref:HupE/UreJ family protein n=1 Tax=Roseovarius sp. TaxID=1486281 RepID=UPI0032EC0B1A
MRYILAVLLLTPSLAFAHLDPAAHGSFAAGATHPLFGADHVLAMLAVGLWAAVLSGRAIWLLPVGFVAAMAVGFGGALLGLTLPAVEPLILASVLILGLLVALAVRLPAIWAVGIVSVFGLFHGGAHGAEIGAATALDYFAGFAVATMGLHLAGLALGVLVMRLGSQSVVRGGGGLVAALGAWLVAAG